MCIRDRTLAYHMKHTDVSQLDDVSRTFVQHHDFELRPQGQIKRVFDESSCLTRNFFGFDIGLPYLAHGCITMRQCERTFMILIQHGYNIDLYSSSNFKVFDMSFCSTQNFVWFYIGIPYWTITIRGFVEYNHDPDATLNFDIKVKWVKYIVFWHVFVPKRFSRLT